MNYNNLSIPYELFGYYSKTALIIMISFSAYMDMDSVSICTT